MKYIRNLLAITIMVSLIVPMTTYATENTTEDIILVPNEDYDYTLNENDEATITKYKGSDSNVIIPETIDGYKVVAIGDYAFLANAIIESVDIPDTVTMLKEGAFLNCSNLESVDFPASLELIEYGVFCNCEKLTEAKLPDSLTNIGMLAFSGCTSLANVKLPRNLEVMGTAAFSDCDALTQIEIPKSLKSVDTPFNKCDNLKTFIFEEGTTTILERFFTGCTGLEEITLPDTITKIEKEAFSSCTNLKKVVMPNGIKEIREYAFARCEKLEDVQLSGGVRSLYESTFEGCTSLEKIVLPYNLHYIATNVFANCTNLKEVTIPYSTIFILDGAFYNPSQLTVYGIPITYAEEWANSVGATFVTYEKPATSVSMLTTEFTITKDSIDPILILEVSPRDFTDRVKWSSSDEHVVTVSDDGYLVWQGGGTATVTAQVGNLTASCEVTSIQEGTVVYVEFEGTYDKVLDIELVDANGNVIEQKGAVGSNDRLPLADLPEGTYTMKVSKENYVPRTYTLFSNNYW